MAHMTRLPRGKYQLQGMKVEPRIISGEINNEGKLINNGAWTLTMKVIANCDGSMSCVGDTFSVNYSQGALLYLKRDFISVLKAKNHEKVWEFFEGFENLSFTARVENGYGKIKEAELVTANYM
jgi:hypothetical protein